MENRNEKQLADVYYRLSKEEFKRGESSSIENQRNVVEAYCREKGITIVKEFVDDGYSGANFERPDFIQMLKHLKDKKACMVITKDLSRLGRDMSESSYYAERYFPEQGIHYIAIADNFDSGGDNMLAPFQFAMNDVYIRDTSRKVKQVLKNKRQDGKYCACPPFGYRKDTRLRDRLVPDEQTAPTVKYIFQLAADGYSSRSIADKLNEEGMIPPLMYRVHYRDEFSDRGAARATDSWNFVTVKRILKNQVYLGHTVLGKTKKASVKSSVKIPLPEEDWYITLNTHEALVSQEQFDKAAYYMKKNTKDWQKHPSFRHSIFGGIAYCETCGGPMFSAGSVYKGERDKYWYLSCNNIPKRSKNHCPNGARIKYGVVLEIVRQDLNRVLNLSDEDIQTITKNALQKIESGHVGNSEKGQADNIASRIKEIDKIISKLYQDNISGKINDERLDRMVAGLETESRSLTDRYNQLTKKASDTDKVKSNYEKFFAMAKGYQHIGTLDRETLAKFIERIEIGPKILPEGLKIASKDTPYRQLIRIHYRFIGVIGKEDIRSVPPDTIEMLPQKIAM